MSVGGKADILLAACRPGIKKAVQAIEQAWAGVGRGGNRGASSWGACTAGNTQQTRWDRGDRHGGVWAGTAGTACAAGAAGTAGAACLDIIGVPVVESLHRRRQELRLGAQQVGDAGGHQCVCHVHLLQGLAGEPSQARRQRGRHLGRRGGCNAAAAAAAAQRRQRLCQAGRGGQGWVPSKARQRHQVDRASMQPHPVLRCLRLQPAGQPIGGLNQQELPVVVPHPAQQRNGADDEAPGCQALPV